MRDFFDIKSNDNALFVTEQCNNHCLMCCQPPRNVDDIDKLYQKNQHLIRSAPKELKVLGITGGEPTLLGEKLFDLIAEIRQFLPDTELHLLSNGRSFANEAFAQRLAEVSEGMIVVGVPLHSDYERDHDKISGCKGAFAETMYGLYNLADAGVPIELRIVVNKLNFIRLPHIAQFIFKNLPFVSWTAFMGMEQTGLAHKNHNAIWVEPVDYVDLLAQAVFYLGSWGLDACIYNIPLCLLPETVWLHAEKSISDWKTQYSAQCDKCLKRQQCCGLFGTSSEEYVGLNPFMS
ncbi:MAG: His-Xaa-Ser system radical SAM maturase HxsC [Bacteroidales bacterium]|nr:His-Xaa-Ser system radical SAM maturase HxsC [Bacteroidales bacterium]